MSNFILTIICAGIMGFIFMKLKVPGGMMVGAIFGAAILNLGFNRAFMPPEAKVLAQMVSGAFIAVGIEKEDLKNVKKLLKPICILVGGMMIMNLVIGTIIYNFTSLDMKTAFFCAVPGGMTDVPIIAGEMGANSAHVALLQFIRMCIGISVFPALIQYIGRNEEDVNKGKANKIKTPYSHKGFLVTMAVAFCAGIAGKVSGMPAGTLLFALIAVIIAKQLYAPCMLPLWARRTAQVLAGSYIAIGIKASDLPAMKGLILPAVILVLGYVVACFLIGNALKKWGGLRSEERRVGKEC